MGDRNGKTKTEIFVKVIMKNRRKSSNADVLREYADKGDELDNFLN